jgi:hypothetical protein
MAHVDPVTVGMLFHGIYFPSRGDGYKLHDVEADPEDMNQPSSSQHPGAGGETSHQDS